MAFGPEAIVFDIALVRSNSIHFEDSLGISAERYRDTADACALADDLTNDLTRSRTVADASTVADTVSTETLYARALTDSAEISDSKTLDIDKNAADSVAFVDTLLISSDVGRVITDSAIPTDTISRYLDAQIQPSDIVSVVDTLAASAELLRTGNDFISATDDTIRGVDFLRVLLDALFVVDDAQRGFVIDAFTQDILSATDAPAEVTFEYGRQPSDSLTVPDTTFCEAAFARQYQDAMMVSERTLIEVSDETDRLVGTEGFDDVYMPVGDTGIVFVANIPAIMTKKGVKFRSRTYRAALLRAASTLAHWGMRDGAIIAFMRTAANLNQQVLAAQCGVSEAVVQDWETDVSEMPRLSFDTLAALVCTLDQRNYGQGFQLVPPDGDTRLYRIVPAIPRSNAAVVRA